jgi:phosphohistidine phosphatase
VGRRAGTVPGHRRLVLLRHAKAAWPHGVPDHERPLAGKGRRNARAAGQWFRGVVPRPDLVLCSDALRARQTWELVAAALAGPAVPLRLEGRLYGADPGDLLDLVREEPDGVGVLAVVGHQPTLAMTALLLAGAGSDRGALARLREKYPTNGIAVLRVDGPWAGLTAGGAVLESFDVPRSDG